MSNFDLICQALLLSKDREPNLLIILYSYTRSFADYLELKFNFFFFISIIDIKDFFKKKFIEFKNFFLSSIFFVVKKLAD